ncbi:MAG: hypothetical protein A2664_03025 [Candidatus Taylorbacteria bacterium RIFCSPHIGHO2_01_FULL_46_22b]|uniref:Uncharacterized protein n=1 Tax=Candidatus Taylorbacteria bacterium RIFCSPHIGHO2_01_FULL_46_22b TaxID=1802301 RepID=A0A1G2M3U7_9BACT|nr:MAG: hypothetical protein A2664_03025 [Candidatus Taylorbacteria bacterium RIFCSPHIGHO2_01_FULL_46_22b]
MSRADTKCGEKFTSDLASFFDFLARFDFEDKQKEQSALGSGPLVSAPKGPGSSSDSQTYNGAETKT